MRSDDSERTADGTASPVGKENIDAAHREIDSLRTQVAALRSENNMLKFKSELLLDMVTLTELDDVHEATPSASSADNDEQSSDVRVVG